MDLEPPQQFVHQPKGSVFSRLNFEAVPDRVFQRSSATRSQIWMPKNAKVSRSQDHKVDLSLNLGVPDRKGRPSFADVVKGKSILTGTNSVLIGSFNVEGPNSNLNQADLLRTNVMGRFPHPLGPRQCSHYLSTLHSRALCSSRVRCLSCFRLGHIASSCHFPPRIPGLSKSPSFSNQTDINDWDSASVLQWFKRPISLSHGPRPPRAHPEV